MAGKSGLNGVSQWNTCGGTILDAKLVRKIHPIVWKWPKMANFWAKNAIFGKKWPQRPLVAGKSGSNGGSQLNTCGRTTLAAKLVRKTHQVVWKWLQSGPFGAKIAVFGHKRLQTPQMAGKSGSNGGSQLNTCGRTTLGAKLVRKTHPVVWKWPQSDPFGAKNAIFGP